MAHFAELNENDEVLRVLVVDNSNIMDELGVERDEVGIQFLKNLFGESTRWIQTSYNAKFRKNYAGPGFTYDPERDAFIPIKIFSSWVLNEETCQWIPPMPYPSDGKVYMWNEAIQSWEEVFEFEYPN